MNLKKITHKVADSSNKKEWWWINDESDKEDIYMDGQYTTDEAIESCIVHGEDMLKGELNPKFSSRDEWTMMLLSSGETYDERNKDMRYMITVSRYGEKKFDVTIYDMKTFKFIRNDSLKRKLRAQKKEFKKKYAWAFRNQ